MIADPSKTDDTVTSSSSPRDAEETAKKSTAKEVDGIVPAKDQVAVESKSNGTEKPKGEGSISEEDPGARAQGGRLVSPSSTASSTTSVVPSKTQASDTKADVGAPSIDCSDTAMKLVKSGKLSSQEAQAVKGLVNDHAALKLKVDRLKGLLGRSAKAQREAKGAFSFCCIAAHAMHILTFVELSLLNRVQQLS